jgi:hypothetical protein
MSPVNAQKLMTALTAFGFGSLGLNAEDFQAPDQIIQLGYPLKLVKNTLIMLFTFSHPLPLCLKFLFSVAVTVLVNQPSHLKFFLPSIPDLNLLMLI